MLDVILILFYFLFCYLLAKTVYVFLEVRYRSYGKKSDTDLGKKTCKTMIVMGSGGHTGEMLRLLENLPENYRPRTYVIADTDKFSGAKVLKLEDSKVNSNSRDFSIVTVKRSREVHQSWTSTVLSTLIAIKDSFHLVYEAKPDLLLCNGPGTCVPLCFVAFLFKIIFVSFRTKIVFIESICRTRTLSLAGRILYYIVDGFFVQWPDLLEKYPASDYVGRIY